MGYNVAIDGPAGAGKSTIAKLVAKKKGYIYVDTGAMYRGLAIHFLKKGVSADDREAVAEACRDAEVTIGYEDGIQQVYLNGENVTSMLRTEEVGTRQIKPGHRVIFPVIPVCRQIPDRFGQQLPDSLHHRWKKPATVFHRLRSAGEDRSAPPGLRRQRERGIVRWEYRRALDPRGPACVGNDCQCRRLTQALLTADHRKQGPYTSRCVTA